MSISFYDIRIIRGVTFLLALSLYRERNQSFAMLHNRGNKDGGHFASAFAKIDHENL